MSERGPDLDDLRRRESQLVEQVRGRLDTKDATYLDVLIDNCEYGEALDVLTSVLISQGRHSIPEPVWRELFELADLMGLAGDEPWRDLASGSEFN